MAPSTSSDAELIRSLRAGVLAARDVLGARYRPLIKRLALASQTAPERVEEMVERMFDAAIAAVTQPGPAPVDFGTVLAAVLRTEVADDLDREPNPPERDSKTHDVMHDAALANAGLIAPWRMLLWAVHVEQVDLDRAAQVADIRVEEASGALRRAEEAMASGVVGRALARSDGSHAPYLRLLELRTVGELDQDAVDLLESHTEQCESCRTTGAWLTSFRSAPGAVLAAAALGSAAQGYLLSARPSATRPVSATASAGRKRGLLVTTTAIAAAFGLLVVAISAPGVNTLTAQMLQAPAPTTVDGAPTQIPTHAAVVPTTPRTTSTPSGTSRGAAQTTGPTTGRADPGSASTSGPAVAIASTGAGIPQDDGAESVAEDPVTTVVPAGLVTTGAPNQPPVFPTPSVPVATSAPTASAGESAVTTATSAVGTSVTGTSVTGGPVTGGPVTGTSAAGTTVSEPTVSEPTVSEPTVSEPATSVIVPPATSTSTPVGSRPTARPTSRPSAPPVTTTTDPTPAPPVPSDPGRPAPPAPPDPGRPAPSPIHTTVIEEPAPSLIGVSLEDDWSGLRVTLGLGFRRTTTLSNESDRTSAPVLVVAESSRSLLMNLAVDHHLCGPIGVLDDRVSCTVGPLEPGESVDITVSATLPLGISGQTLSVSLAPVPANQG